MGEGKTGLLSIWEKINFTFLPYIQAKQITGALKS